MDGADDVTAAMACHSKRCTTEFALGTTGRTVAVRPIANTHRTDEHGTDAGHFKGAGQG